MAKESAIREDSTSSEWKMESASADNPMQQPRSSDPHVIPSRELACSGAFDEISNIEDGAGIERYVRGHGLLGRGGKTQKVLFFVVYQTGQLGPQNGYRLCLVKEGVTPQDAREKLKGHVAQDSADYVVVSP